MTKTNRVRNITRGFSLKRSQAERAVEQCACAWVEFGKTIRDLNIAESIAKRNEQAANREPLPLAELHGVKYEPAISQLAGARQNYHLVADANRFCAEYAAQG